MVSYWNLCSSCSSKIQHACAWSNLFCHCFYPYITHMRLYTSSSCFSVLCRNQLFGTSKSVLCREIVSISKGLLLEILLYLLTSPLLLLRLTEEDIKPDSILSLTYVKFQNVQSLTVSIVTYNVSRNLHNSNLNGQMWYVVHIVIWFTKLLCWQAIHNSHPPSHQCHVTITLPSHDSSHSYSFKTTREGRRQQWWTT